MQHTTCNIQHATCHPCRWRQQAIIQSAHHRWWDNNAAICLHPPLGCCLFLEEEEEEEKVGYYCTVLIATLPLLLKHRSAHVTCYDMSLVTGYHESWTLQLVDDDNSAAMPPRLDHCQFWKRKTQIKSRLYLYIRSIWIATCYYY